jgi:NADPH:quinone reductase-like Zn-dependent oxidoreductase
MVKSLGADKVIDYTQEDFAQKGERYDYIFDAVEKASEANCKKALTPNGAYVLISKVNYKETAKDLIFLKGLLVAGKIKPVIDRVYLLEEIAQDHRYVETGHKKGNVVVTLDNE